jgi:hypothetical protein
VIVYVETNFLLQLAPGQEQAPAADDLLRLAEQRRCALVIPAFCLSEPFATLAQRERARRNLRSTLSEQLRQLRRSTPHQDAAAALEPLLQFLHGLEREAVGRLPGRRRILATAETVRVANVANEVMRGAQVGDGLGSLKVGADQALAHGNQDGFGA